MLEMKQEQTTMVSISLAEYKHLAVTEATLVMLIDVLYNGAILSFDKRKLIFDDTALEHLLRVMDADRYNRTLEAVKKAKEGDHE